MQGRPGSALAIREPCLGDAGMLREQPLERDKVASLNSRRQFRGQSIVRLQVHGRVSRMGLGRR